MAQDLNKQRSVVQNMSADGSSEWNSESEYQFLDFYQDECDHTFNRRLKTLHYLNRVTGYNVEGNRIVFNCLTNRDEKVKVVLEVCSPDIFRMKMSAIGKLMNHDTLMVVRYDWPTTEFEVTQDHERVFIRTQNLSIDIVKSPWQIIVKDSKGIIAKEAVVYWPYREDVSYWPHREASPLGFSANKSNGEIRVFDSFAIFPDEHFYGLGEKFVSLDKRGRDVICWNVDAGASTTTDRAYKNIPFFISTNGYGIFVNSSHKIRFQMGSYSDVAYSFEVYDQLMDYYFIHGPGFNKILDRYTDITGKSPVPPIWSFGTWMSHIPHSLDNRETILAFAQRIRKEKIPCDVLHIGGWLRPSKCPGLSCDLVWDEERFSNPEEMLKILKEMHFKVCLWISPYVPSGTPMHEDGDEKGYFAKDEKGNTYRGLTWGARNVGILDFTNPTAVLWFKDRLKGLMRMGVDAFKTDMGEYIPRDTTFFNGMKGDEMHNIYPVLYHKTVFEATKEFHGIGIVWGRGGYAGVQRYPLQWAGDPRTRYEDMSCVLRAGLSYGLSGVPFWSHDAGGFFGEPSLNLYMRWIQFGFLSSHTRCYGTTPRHPWAFGAEAVEIFRKYAELRYRLIPYLYSYAKVASMTGLPLMRAVPLEFQEDVNTYSKDLQYMLGKELMIAPILNDEGKRWIYFPFGKWFSWWDGSVFEGPSNFFYTAKIDELPMFVREGAIVPLGPVMDYIGQKRFNPLTIEVYPHHKSEFVLYKEDSATNLNCVKSESRIEFSVDGENRQYILRFHNTERPKSVCSDGTQLKQGASKDEFETKNYGWWYDRNARILCVRFTGQKSALSIMLS